LIRADKSLYAKIKSERTLTKVAGDEKSVAARIDYAVLCIQT
jgi:hypothetical protein